LEYLKKENPDVMCLNELKCNEKTKPEELNKIEGYPHTYWAYNTETSGHSGIAILSKTEPKSVKHGLPISDTDSAEDKKAKEGFNKEGRLITAEYENFYLINTCN
jgi:exonuclease III